MATLSSIITPSNILTASNAETLTNKTLAFASNTMTGVASTSTSQTLTNKTISGANNTLTNISLSTAVTGTLPVANGGTGATSLSGVVIGNGTSAFSVKTNPDGAFVGTTDTQTLTNKTLTSPAITNALVTTARETATVSAIAATGTINYDAVTQSVLYYTSNASGNWTLNVRGNSGTTLNALMGIGQSLTIAFLVTNGATAYYQTGFQVDGSSVTPKWQGGTAPTGGNASSIDIYSITIVKTANATFTAFASQTKFA